jgi:hypothetical protein
MSDSTPIEGIASAVCPTVHVIDQEPECREPGEREEKIDWPVEEAGCERQKPEESEKDGDGGDDFDVDEASQRRTTAGSVVMEIL